MFKVTSKDGTKSANVTDLTPAALEAAAAQMGVPVTELLLPDDSPVADKPERTVIKPEEQTQPKLGRDPTLDKEGEPKVDGEKEAYPGMAAKVASSGAAQFYRERIPEEFRKKKNPLPGAEDPSKSAGAVGDYSGLLKKPGGP